MKHELKKKFEKLDLYKMDMAANGFPMLMLNRDDVEELLNSLTREEYCGACGGGLALSRHDD